MIVINASGSVAGRTAAHVAKLLLAGETVAVVETQDLVLSGTLAAQQDRMNRRRLQQDKRDPEKSPKFPRVPHLMFKRMVRGMLPKKTQRGRDALKLLRAYTGTPEELVGKAAPAPATLKKEIVKKTTLGKLCQAFGYTAPQ